MRRHRLIVPVVVVLAAACSDTPATTGVPAPTVPPAAVATVSTATASVTSERLTTTTLSPPPQVDADSPCARRATFGDPTDSEYVLPYPVGGDYYVSQAYCTAGGSHADQLAYDFSIPIGHVVVAARAGEVVDLEEGFPDDGEGYGEHNYVMVRHADGTVAFYAHLQQHEVVVEVGDRVEISEPIALSGNSGQTGEAHLHFGVYRSWPPSEGFDVPVVFRNAGGPLDAWGGLRVFGRYEALPDPGPPGG